MNGKDGIDVTTETYSLRNSRFGQDKVKPIEIGFVSIGRGIRIGSEGRRTTGADMESNRYLGMQAKEICKNTCSRCWA